MDQTVDMLSPTSSLLDAEGDIESIFGEMPQHQDDPAAPQTGISCEMEAIEVNQADRHASPTLEPCLPEYPAALTASRGEAGQAMLESEVTHPNPVEAYQAMASTGELEVSGPNHAGVAMTSTSEQESESGSEDSTQPLKSPHRVISATETASVVPHEALRDRKAKIGIRTLVARGTSDLPILIPGDEEPSRSIVVDDDGD